MSNFYNQASWVLVPSGIEEDIVFAQKPISGLGDLSFTRASDATYTDSTGVVRRSPYNLLTYSEQFDNAAWTKQTSTITANATTAPNGTLTSDKLIAQIGGGSAVQHRIDQTTVSAAGSKTFSVYAKKEEIEFIFLRIGLSYAWFNLNDGSVSNVSADIVASSVDAGSGWYRLIITKASAVANEIVRINLSTGSGLFDFIGNGTDGAFLWGAQLVEGTSALDYFPTTNRQDVPRIDFRNADGTLSSCGRLLLEPQRTNSIRNSSMVGAVAGTPGTLPTNYNEVLGGLTRSVVAVGTENGLPYVDLRFNGTATSTSVLIGIESPNAIAATVGQSWTESAYCKIISATSNANSYALLVYERSLVGTYLTEGSTVIVPTSNLQRFAFTRTTTSATIAFIQPYIRFNLTNGATYDFTIRIAAPQMELGAYATTWVPTTTAAVTRLADTASKTGVSSLIGQTEGTLYCEFNIGSDTFDGDLISVNGGSSANGFFVSFRSSKLVQLIVRTSSTNALIFQRLGNYPIGTNKIAVAYKNGDFAISLNGTAAQVNTSTITMPTGISVIELSVPRLYTSPMPIAQAQAAIFPTRLTNAELAQITTL